MIRCVWGIVVAIVFGPACGRIHYEQHDASQRRDGAASPLSGVDVGVADTPSVRDSEIATLDGGDSFDGGDSAVQTLPPCGAPGPTVSLRGVGAACDGLTDDAAAFDRALAAVPSGGTILVDCSVSLSRAIRVEARQLIAFCGNGSATIIAATDDGVFTSSGLGGGLIGFIDVDRVRIDNVRFDIGRRLVAAISATETRNVTVSNNAITFARAMGPALIVSDDNDRLRVEGNTIVGPGVDGGGADGTRGIWIGNFQHVERNAIVQRNALTGTPYTSIVFYGDGEIAHNVVLDSFGIGIEVVAEASTTGVGLHNNRVERSRLAGISFPATAPGPVAATIVITDNHIRRNGGPGLELGRDSFGASIARNTLEENCRIQPSAGAVVIRGVQGSLTIADNVMEGGPTNSHHIGIDLELNSTPGSGVRVERNQIRSQSNVGMRIGPGSTPITVDLRGNIVERSTNAGVHIQSAVVGSLSVDGTNCFSMNGGVNILDQRAGVPIPNVADRICP